MANKDIPLCYSGRVIWPRVCSLPSGLCEHNLHQLRVCYPAPEVGLGWDRTLLTLYTRRCDTKNIGMTMLCKFDGDVPLPAVWSYQVLNEYKKSYPEEELPDFLKYA